MTTQNAINIGDSSRCFTGVSSWGGSGNYFDDTTLGSFTVLRTGTGFVLGKPVAWTAPQTITGLAAGNTYYICIDSTGSIYKTTDEDTAYGGNYMPLFECLRDSTSPTNEQITVREDHPYNMPYLANHYLHDSIGTIIENHDNGANITLNGTRKIQINGADELMDHGLSTAIPDSGGVAVSWRKKYTNASGKWCLQNFTDTFSGYYNNAGTPTVLGSNKYGVYTLYVSKDNLNSSTPTYYAILDTSQYSNQGAASSAIAAGTIARASNELETLELCRLGYIIYGQSANAIVQVIISKSTFQASVTQTGSNAASLINTVVTNFDGILSSANTNVQSALETIDDFSKAPFAQADPGSGTASKTILTNVVNTSVSTGAMTILSTTSNPGNSAGYIKMYVGTSVVYVPYFTNIAP